MTTNIMILLLNTLKLLMFLYNLPHSLLKILSNVEFNFRMLFSLYAHIHWYEHVVYCFPTNYDMIAWLLTVSFGQLNSFEEIGVSILSSTKLGPLFIYFERLSSIS